MTRSTSVIADSQRKYFEDHLQEHHILSLFNYWDKIEDLLPKYQDLFPSFDLIIIQIGSNNCSSWDNETSILTKMQHLLLQIERKVLEIVLKQCQTYIHCFVGTTSDRILNTGFAVIMVILMIYMWTLIM